MPNYYARFLESVQRFPQMVAVEYQPQQGEPSRYSYTELRRMSDSVGRWLTEQQVPQGARCAILAQNGPRWVAAYLATLASGCVTVPLDTALNAEQVAKLLIDSGSSLLFVDSKYLPVAQRIGVDVRLVLLDGAQFDGILAAGPGTFTPAEVPAQETAAILYSSGTTGDPKGVMLTHDNFSAEADAVFAFIDLTTHDAVLGILPLFHALAQAANLLLPLAAGARIVYLESINTAELLRALRERDITIFVCVPQFFYLIHERLTKEVAARGALARVAFRALLGASRLSRKSGFNLGKVVFKRVHQMLGPKMRYMVTGGSRFDPAIGHDFEALGFTMLQAYGLTETSGGATCTRPGEVVISSVGKPLPGVEVRIVDTNAKEDAAGVAVGEVAIRGRIAMKGYYNRPDATAAALRDGWLYTGDLGYLDAHGNLVISGREKEVIVLSSGKNIYPEEIEAHYRKSPYVKQICVLGLQSRPNEPFSERLHAVIVPNFELLRERKIVNAREILRFEIEGLSAQLPSTKRILSYEIWVDELPLTTTRKLKRFEIERRVQERKAASSGESELAPARRLTDEERQWLAQPDVARALAVIRKASKVQKDEIYPADNLELDLGLDSMERVELLVALERELGAHVEDSIVSEVYTVRELVDAVRQNVGTTGVTSHQAAWEAVLKEEPTDPEVLALATPRPLATRTWFLLSRLAQLLARDLFQLRVTGLEKLPEKGPYIICPNHQSFLDAPVLYSSLPWNVLREVFFVGTSEIFGAGILRRLGRTLHLVPVDPDANLIPAMRAGAYGLRRGKVLMLFPEGERSIDGIPKTFKKGAAILAAHLKVPIYPVAVAGFHEAWPRGKFLQRFAPLRIAIGDPLFPPPDGASADTTYERLTAELKARVMDMWVRLHQENGFQRSASAEQPLTPSRE
jgi:long-chain acyl-CoA synthetase